MKELYVPDKVYRRLVRYLIQSVLEKEDKAKINQQNQKAKS